MYGSRQLIMKLESLGSTKNLSQEEFERSRLHGLKGDINPFIVGGSDSPIIRGVSKYGTPYGLYLKKLYPEKYRDAADVGLQHIFTWGHLVEDAVGKMNAVLLAEKLGKDVEYIPFPLQVRNPRWPHCVANIDGFLRIAEDFYIADVKSTRPWSSNWTDYFKNDTVPDDYIHQLHFYGGIYKEAEGLIRVKKGLDPLNVKDIKGMYILAASGFATDGSGSSFRQIPVSYDRDLAIDILDDCEEFVVNAAKGIAPKNSNVQSVEAFQRDLSTIYQPTTSEDEPPTTLNTRYKPVLAEMVRLNDEIKEAEEKRKALEKELSAEDPRMAEIKGLQSTARKLEKQLQQLGLSVVVELNNAKQGIIKDGKEAYVIDVDVKPSWGSATKTYFRDKYPDVWDDVVGYAPSIKPSARLVEIE